MEEKIKTKILVMDCDGLAFDVEECVARVLMELPPLELFRAKDATEALLMMESLNPDVVLVEDDAPGERELLLDSLGHSHPPILIRTEEEFKSRQFSMKNMVNYIEKNNSIEGIRQTLILSCSMRTVKDRDLQ